MLHARERSSVQLFRSCYQRGHSKMKLLAELSQLGTIFGIFAVIFVVKSRVSIVEL